MCESATLCDCVGPGRGCFDCRFQFVQSRRVCSGSLYSNGRCCGCGASQLLQDCGGEAFCAAGEEAQDQCGHVGVSGAYGVRDRGFDCRDGDACGGGRELGAFGPLGYHSQPGAQSEDMVRGFLQCVPGVEPVGVLVAEFDDVGQGDEFFEG